MSVVTEERYAGFIPAVRTGAEGNRDSDDDSSSFPVTRGQLGLWILLTGITMLFAGLMSAYVVLRGMPAWQSIAMPSMLWVNTTVLILSSFTMALSLRAIRNNHVLMMKGWLAATALLGLAFLAGQVAAWRQLVMAGVYLPSTLQSALLYVFTSIHGVHLLGGVIALSFVLGEALKNRVKTFHHESLKLCATYWHFMDALWVCLFLLLILS